MKFQKLQRIVQILFILVCLFNFAKTQTATSSITKESLEYDGILGIGWGVFAIIVSIIIGILCCILGLATIYPGVFTVIGFALPILIFIFMAFTPLHQPGNQDLKNNLATNSYIVVRWLFFTVMLLAVLGMFVPLFILWANMLIPQRVDSRAQREYYEKYEKLLAEEREKIQKERESKSRQAVGDIQNQNGEVLLPVRVENNSNNPNPIDNENEAVDEHGTGNENDNLNPTRTRKRNLIGLRRRKDPNNDEKQD